MYKLMLVSFVSLVTGFVYAQEIVPPKTIDGKVSELPKLNAQVDSRYIMSQKKWDSLKGTITPSLNEPTAIGANTTPVVMPSPNSSTLVNLISENVDLYTGKTSISLPLYNLKCGNINVPISLQSSVNAYKVNDIGTSTGLGMSLNLGGAITRVMKNLPDEYAGTISPSFNIPGWGYLNIKGNNQNVDLSVFDNPNTTPSTLVNIISKGNWNKKSGMPDNGWDLQPDEFYFNFGNYSGKFVFDQDGNVNLIPQSNLKFTPLFQNINGVNKITGFTVLTDDGFKYEFGNPVGGDYNTAAVEETKLSVNTSSIQYTYRAFAQAGGYLQIYGGIPLDPDSYGQYFYERYPYVLGGIPGPTNSNTNPAMACCLLNFDNPDNNDNTEYCSYPSTWMLVKITSPTGDWVYFNYSGNTTTYSYLADRSFSASCPDLGENKVTFTNNSSIPAFTSPMIPVPDYARQIYVLPSKQTFTVSKSTIELKTKKIISIITSDITTVDFSNTTPREDLPGDTRLDYMRIINSNFDIVKKINFNYNTVTTTETEFPDEQFKFFYNNSRYWYDNGTPQTYLGMHSNYVVNQFYPFTDDIKTWKPSLTATSDEYRKRMFLTSIQEESNGVTLPPYVFNYDAGKLPFRTSVDQDYFGFATYNPTKHPFLGNANNGNKLSYYYFNPQTGAQTIAPTYINSSSGAGYNPILYFKTWNTSTGAWTDGLNGGNKNYLVTAMQAGVLNKITYPTGGYKEYLSEFNGSSSAWNGLRVYQTKEYESPTATPIIKNYTYGTFVNTDAVVYNYDMPENGVLVGTTFYLPTLRKFFSSSRSNPESLTHGTAGGYTFAEISQTNNGKQRTEFYTAQDFADQPTSTNLASTHTNPPVYPLNFSFPFPPASSFDYKRGFPKKEIIYDNSGNILKSEEYLYNHPTSYGIKTIPAVNPSHYTVSNLSGSSSWEWHMFGKSNYYSEWYPPYEKITTERGMTSHTVSSYRKYQFNNKEYLYPLQTRVYKNNFFDYDKNMITYYQYPLEYNTTGAVDSYLQGIAQLVSKNVLSSLIEQYSFRMNGNGDRIFVSGVMNKYHTDKPLVKEMFKLKTPNGFINTFNPSYAVGGAFYFDSHYNSELNMPSYDINGRMLEQNKTSDIQESYIWNYYKEYPVAKVINATKDEIAYTSFESDDASSKLNINISNIIDDAPNALTGRKYYYLSSPITSNISVTANKRYKLTFWAKGGDPFIMHYLNGIPQFVSIPTPLKTKAGWNYYEVLMPSDFAGIASLARRYTSDNVYADEVRLIPEQAQITTYTFTPLIGMTSESDVNSKTTYYEYDELNRLAVIKNEDKDIVKTICYNYANQVVPCAPTCPAPVITSVVRTGFNVSLYYTAPANSTNCVIQIIDLTTGAPLSPVSGACSSPAALTVPTKFHPYSVTVTSYSAQCPGGVQSLPFNF